MTDRNGIGINEQGNSLSSSYVKVQPLVHKPAVLKGEYLTTQESFMNFIENNFAENLPGYDKDPEGAVRKTRHIVCSSMKIKHRYLCRPLESLSTPLTPQEQSIKYIEIGLKMSIPTIKEAAHNAGLQLCDIGCIVFVSHSPFPCPAFTAHLMSEVAFKKDCVQLPCNTMACAAGGHALQNARNYLLANPEENVLVLCVELCSLGFRPHKSGMSWFINSGLFGDCVAAFVVSGSNSKRNVNEITVSEPNYALALVNSKQRLIPNTTHVLFYTYDEWGYHFMTTPEVCNVAQENGPQFAVDLAQESLNKLPKDLQYVFIHTGGARMISNTTNALDLVGTRSEQILWNSMSDGGNIASVTIIDQMAKSWSDFQCGDQGIIFGMGVGFLFCGVAFVVVPI